MIPSSANILEGPLRTKELKLLPGKERAGLVVPQLPSTTVGTIVLQD